MALDDTTSHRRVCLRVSAKGSTGGMDATSVRGTILGSNYAHIYTVLSWKYDVDRASTEWETGTKDLEGNSKTEERKQQKWSCSSIATLNLLLFATRFSKANPFLFSVEFG